MPLRLYRSQEHYITTFSFADVNQDLPLDSMPQTSLTVLVLLFLHTYTLTFTHKHTGNNTRLLKHTHTDTHTYRQHKPRYFQAHTLLYTHIPLHHTSESGALSPPFYPSTKPSPHIKTPKKLTPTPPSPPSLQHNTNGRPESEFSQSFTLILLNVSSVFSSKCSETQKSRLETTLIMSLIFDLVPVFTRATELREERSP